MENPVAVLDTSCVIALDAAGLLPRLSILFSRLLLPGAVRRELFQRPGREERVEILCEEFGFIQRCDDYDPAAAEVLLIGRPRRGRRDRGEAEAIVQAAQHGAIAVIDDRRGRALAARHALEFHGTFWVLSRLLDLGLITGAEFRQHVLKMLSTGIRLPIRNVNRKLRDLGEAGV